MPYKIITPLFPTYAQAAALINAASGYSIRAVRNMITAIQQQTGTPQNPVDWSAPDVWIPARLKGEEAALAMRIWQQSGHILNPRHSYGAYMFINNFALMETGDADACWPSERGEAFLRADADTLAQIDDAEGILYLLELLAGREQARRGELLPEWMAFLRQSSKVNTENSGKSALYNRLANLLDRDLISREGMSYQITAAGRQWLTIAQPDQQPDPRNDLLDAIRHYNDQQKRLLHEQLLSMNPYRFEHLISQLLEAMGYEDVEVTKASGDKGVDVVGRVQVGITTVTEVVQVKRMQNTVTRPLIDQLRGALPYHKAIRGTLITTGKFARNCTEAALFPGAAPITLIDGERLLELLISNNVGIKRNHNVELLDVDTQWFEEFDRLP